MRRAGVLIALLLALPSSASAAELVANGSFEEPALSGGWATVGVGHAPEELPGWTVTLNTVDLLSSDWQAAAGSQSLDLAGSPGPGAIKQTLATVAGKKYRIRYSVASNPPATCGGFPTKTFDVLWNGAVVRHQVYVAADDASATNMGWQSAEIEL